ncbi:DinB family protein [Fodinibius saliphilus]|uniref:DinB family protein n=1 Tax=Fodinibius saliphilus TaxID=1920650 RepID=UPI001107CE35|nr:DinB family protein [Fodinibius saliphilus]
MELIPLFIQELEQEVKVTRQFLEAVPVDKFDWKPHDKSMSMQRLAIHIAEIPGWIETALTTRVLDFAEDEYEPTPVKDTNGLLSLLEESVAKANKALENAIEEDLLPTWTMCNGDQVLIELPKHGVIRHSFNQIIHHRAQLGVYFRLLDIPVPNSYGPTANNQEF